MTRFQNARAALFTRLSAGAGVSGRYIVDDLEEEMVAIEGRWQHQGDAVEDLPLIQTDSSWLFKRAELIIDGELKVPQSGHEWHANGRKYQVLPPFQGARCFEPLGNDGHTIRIHMKDIGAIDG